jgi:DNA-binding XRE family transcriptional regulator
MSTDFSKLIADIEQEARDEGPQATRELQQFREEFGLASQLIQSRREVKFSQRDLAKLSGVAQSEISRIETGASNPTYATISALLRPLGKHVQLVDDSRETLPTGSAYVKTAKGAGSAKKFSRGRRAAAARTAAGKASSR